MPVLIDPPAPNGTATLDDVVTHCRSAAFDPEERDSLIAAAPVLAALGNNRYFLADLAVDALKQSCRDQVLDNGYSPQVLMLSPPDGRFFIRANIWPSDGDRMLRDSSREAFFYGMPHDHSFDFLTIGYAGPGYWSDYYEYDGNVDGVPGERVGLRFVERSRLDQGKLLLYRANVDVHDQIPPDAMSVSINIMPMTARQAWRRQYFFDLSAATIRGCATVTGAEILLPLSVRFGGDNARDLAEAFAATHSDPRLRLAAWKALDSVAPSIAERERRVEGALRHHCPLIRDHGRRWLAQSRTGPDRDGGDRADMISRPAAAVSDR